MLKAGRVCPTGGCGSLGFGGEGEGEFGDFVGGEGFSEEAAGASHLIEVVAVPEEGAEGAGEDLGVQVGIGDHHRGAGVAEGFDVADLFAGGGVGPGDDDGGEAADGDLGDGGGAATGDDEVGRGEGVRAFLVEEGNGFIVGEQVSDFVGGEDYAVGAAVAGDVEELDLLEAGVHLSQQAQGADEGLVDLARAQAAADDGDGEQFGVEAQGRGRLLPG